MRAVGFLLMFLCGEVYSDILNLYINDTCSVNNTTLGRCTPHKLCQELDVRIERPNICSFRDGQPIVCCRENKLEKETEKRILSEIQCVNDKIKLDEDVSDVALIGYDVGKGMVQWGCEGTLVSERWVLTAGFCANLHDLGEAKWVQFIKSGGPAFEWQLGVEDAEIVAFEIVEKVVHPDFKLPSAYNDIALFKLNASWTPSVSLDSLPQTPNLPMSATVIQWTQNSSLNVAIDYWLKVNVSLMEEASCKLIYENSRLPEAPNGINSTMTICVGEIKRGEGNYDYCCSRASTGSSLVIHNQCGPTLIGILVRGKPCGQLRAPSLYTRVAPYMDWIQSIISE